MSVRGLTENDWSGKAGVAFYQDMLTWLALVPNALACQGGSPTCNLAELVDYGTQTAKQAGYPDFVIPTELGGIINDQNVDVNLQLYMEKCILIFLKTLN